MSLSRPLQNILIIEPARDFAERMVRFLKQIGTFNVVVVPTLRDACLHLMQNHQDLAFIPVAEGNKIVRALRAVQPDLRLILMTPNADYEMPATYSGSVQAVLIKPLMHIELRVVLEKALDQPFVVHDNHQDEGDHEFAVLDTAVLTATLDQARLDRLTKSVVFSHNKKLLAHRGALKEQEAATVALHVGQGWDDALLSRIQFLHLPARAGDLLLYTHHVLHSHFLTLVALPETPLGDLRAQAAQLVVSLKKLVLGRTAPLMLPQAMGSGVDGRSSYAVVWRPSQRLPDSLTIPLRRALQRIAVANACVITHIDVQPELVHLVVNCPPGRDSTWAVYLFKNGSEQTIQKQFGVAARLWETGFYAAESTNPLPAAQLSLFLEHTP